MKFKQLKFRHYFFIPILAGIFRSLYATWFYNRAIELNEYGLIFFDGLLWVLVAMIVYSIIAKIIYVLIERKYK